MAATFDIFSGEPSGAVLWIESAADLQTAKERVRAIGASSPGNYTILNQVSGDSISVQVNVLGVLTTLNDDAD
jgi:hypothetical protein